MNDLFGNHASQVSAHSHLFQLLWAKSGRVHCGRGIW